MKETKEILRISGDIKDGEIKAINFNLSIAWYLFYKTLKAYLKNRIIKCYSIHYWDNTKYSIIFQEKKRNDKF